MPEEAKKEIAAGADEQILGRGFDPFVYIIQQLTNMDARYEARFDRIETRIDKLDNKIDTQINALRQEMQENITALRQEMQQGDAALRRDMQQGDAALLQAVQSLQQEMRSIQRWSMGSLLAVVVGLGGVIASFLAILARLPQ
ncbi:MAG: hypothetical protein PWP65_467 [Clostridia bacterium]|nr:hypothetical protein [Clostridia bacterium]